MNLCDEDISYGDNTFSTSFALSYAEDTSYEEQVAALPPIPILEESATDGLKGRISRNKVYLPPESMTKGKRRREDAVEDDMEDDLTVTTEDGLRPNGLYLYGNPISHLPTNNLFGYARHHGAEPVALEWVDDKTCVFVFPSVSTCQAALAALRKLPDEEPDFDDCVTAKPVPLVLWPAEDRVNSTLGVGDGLRDTLHIRIARTTDRKVKGSKGRSRFYQKHGTNAGKDPNAHSIGHAQDREGVKRQRVADDITKRQQLDDELDDFLSTGDPDQAVEAETQSRPSKMRSEHFSDSKHEVGTGSGKSLLDRTSLMRLHSNAEEERKMHARRIRRRGQRRDGRGGDAENVKPRRTERTERPSKTREELDNELDAFLKGP